MVERAGLRPDRKVTDLLKKESFTLSAEIIPPRNGASAASIAAQIDLLTRSGAQFLAVTKGAGGSLRGGSLPIAQMIKEGFQVPCIAHFTCRDLLPEEVENQLVDHNFFGIRNVLALRGDPPVGVANWVPREGSHEHAYQLIEQIRSLNEGHYLERKGFKSGNRERTDFCIGAACYPDHENSLDRIDYFVKKVEAGAEFAISQMMFCADSYSHFLEDCSKRGIEIPVFPGTRLLRSREQAARVRQRFNVPIPARLMEALPSESESQPDWGYAIDVITQLGEEFRKAGAPGFHLFVMNDLEPAQVLFQRLSGISARNLTANG